MKHQTLIFVLSILISLNALAWERVSEPRMEFGLGLGATKIGGDFADGSPSTSSYIINIVFPVFKKDNAPEQRGMFGYFQIGGDMFQADYKGSGYPFQREKGAQFNKTSMNVYMCWGRESVFQPCLGVGYGILRASQDSAKYVQEYGATSFGFSLRYILGDKWLTGLDSQYYGHEAATNDVKSTTDFWTNRVVLLYRWDYPDYDQPTN